MKVVRLSALGTGRLYPPGNIPGTHFCYRLSQPQGHSATGKIMSMKTFHDPIGNRTRDLPVCSVVPQPTALPRAPTRKKSLFPLQQSCETLRAKFSVSMSMTVVATYIEHFAWNVYWNAHHRSIVEGFDEDIFYPETVSWFVLHTSSIYT